jgi:pRiA4b ORF-3-like protein/RNA polymerase alpha subunit
MPKPITSLALKVTLCDVEPPVWRRLLLPSVLTLRELHRAIQIAMGWSDYHLHAFRIGDREYANLEQLDERCGEVDERSITLAEIAAEGITSFEYEYDFGDGWEHAIEVEEIDSATHERPICLAGARACPPEDCGGPNAYNEILAVLAGQPSGASGERRDGIPADFEPARFELDPVNAALAKEFRASFHAFAEYRLSGAASQRALEDEYEYDDERFEPPPQKPPMRAWSFDLANGYQPRRWRPTISDRAWRVMLLHGWLDRETLQRAQASGLVASLPRDLRQEIESPAALEAIDSWWKLMAHERGLSRLMVHRQLTAGELALLASASMADAERVLSARARNVLIRAGIHSALDLATTPVIELLKVNNCGDKTIRELQQYVEGLLSRVH